MSGRKSRLAQDRPSHQVPREGARVFAADPSRKPVMIPLSHDASTEHGILVRWPAGVPMGRQPWPPPPEYIYLDQRARSSRPLPADPYRLDEIFPPTPKDTP